MKKQKLSYRYYWFSFLARAVVGIGQINRAYIKFVFDNGLVTFDQTQEMLQRGKIASQKRFDWLDKSIDKGYQKKYNLKHERPT